MLEPRAPYPTRVFVSWTMYFNCKRWLTCCYHARVFWESRSHHVFPYLLLATSVHRSRFLSTEGGLMLEPSASYPTRFYVPGAIDFNCKRWLSCCYHARVGFLGIAFSLRFPVPPARNLCPPKVDSVHQRWTHACAECTTPFG